MARKLLKSGAISAIQKPATKQDQTSFKRPKGQERKRIISDGSAAPYLPFSSTLPNDGFTGAGGAEGIPPDTTSRVHNRMLILTTFFY